MMCCEYGPRFIKLSPTAVVNQFEFMIVGGWVTPKSRDVKMFTGKAKWTHMGAEKLAS
jgi:hypothetical protein